MTSDFSEPFCSTMLFIWWLCNLLLRLTACISFALLIALSTCNRDDLCRKLSAVSTCNWWWHWWSGVRLALGQNKSPLLTKNSWRDSHWPVLCSLGDFSLVEGRCLCKHSQVSERRKRNLMTLTCNSEDPVPKPEVILGVPIEGISYRKLSSLKIKKKKTAEGY